MKLLNITHLDISRTDITSECFENLKTLIIYCCANLRTLDKLNIPSLEELSCEANYLEDANVVNIFSGKMKPLKMLRLSYNIQLTDKTLENLSIITVDGI